MPYHRSYVCAENHKTESDFGNAANFAKAVESGLLECACCGSRKVQAELASPRLSRGASAPAEKQPEYVGHRFTEVMREIDAGQSPDRPIFGTATSKEIQKLADDGIGPFHLIGKARSYDA